MKRPERANLLSLQPGRWKSPAAVFNSMQRSRFILVLLGVLFACSSGVLPAHPFKASVTEVRQNPESGRIEVTLKLFTDDLEECVRERSGKLLNLDTSRELASSDDLLNEYLQSGFRLEINGEALDLEFLGREHEPGVTWCFLESKPVEAVSEFYAVNSIMTEMYSTQSNIVHVEIGGQKKSLLLRPGKLSGRLVFSK